MQNLTACQQKKYTKLLEKYPNIFNMEPDAALSTVEIGECIGSHSKWVIRDLQRISKRLDNHFSIQIMVKKDRAKGFRPLNVDLDSECKGGRQKLSSREKGFKGTSHWIRLTLVDK